MKYWKGRRTKVKWFDLIDEENWIFTLHQPFQMKQSNSFIWMALRVSHPNELQRLKTQNEHITMWGEKSFPFNLHAHMKFGFPFSPFLCCLIVSHFLLKDHDRAMTDKSAESDHRGLADYFLLEETVLVLLLAELLWELKGTQLEADVLNFRVEDNSIWCWSDGEMGTT